VLPEEPTYSLCTRTLTANSMSRWWRFYKCSMLSGSMRCCNFGHNK